MNSKYPCNVIQDLLPLYLDGVCSEESKSAVEAHLTECPVCQKFYSSLDEADKMVVEVPAPERECQKAASFQAVKKKMYKKQLLYAMLPISLLIILSVACIWILKNKTKIVMYDNNISVSMTDGDLIGRLQGSQPSQVEIKRVETGDAGQEEIYLFFCVYDTKWSEMTTTSNAFTEYTLCCSDKGADQIDAVYYYTGDYTGIETLDRDNLQKDIDASTLLWSADGK